MLDGTVRPDDQVKMLAHSEELFPVRIANRGPSVTPLRHSSKPLRPFEFASDGKTYNTFDYLSLNRVAGLLVLKNGEVSFEDYELGNDESTRWASFSVAKSVTSTLLGAAIKDGYVRSLDDLVTAYLPQLRGSAYDGVTIRNVIQMTSGVRWSEAYADRNSDLRKLTEQRMTLRPGVVLGFMSSLERANDPGTVLRYNTGETYLLGDLLEAAIQRPLTQYLSEKIWSQVGMERDATWWLESPGGMVLAGAGIAATLRDYGRFGLFVLNDGRVGANRIVPEGWFSEAGSAKVVGGNSVDYGYMWWPIPAGEPIHAGAFKAQGLFGQVIYINPSEKVVVVVLSSRSKPGVAGVIKDNDFFAAVIKALH
jgi:CubicO group peptidase (beta-lactamase class C family)